MILSKAQITFLFMSTVNYFGTEVQWRSFQDGIREIISDHKPGIILIEKTWCPTCKKVGQRYQNDPEFLELSKQFVMICCMDDEEPNYDEFRPGTLKLSTWLTQ